ncbi:hypothetical protein GGI07_004833 [Coemansia sp. Benny D115]|nr:hypothetical protein GGI07_004833 [Coemansia sp. Benny D115]
MASREAATQFAYRAAKEMNVIDAPPVSQAVKGFSGPGAEVRSLKYSPNGKCLAWSVASEVRVLDAQTLDTIAVLARANILDVRFSPKATYLVTWERYSKKAEGDAGAEADSTNLKVWETATGQLLGGFVQSSFTPDALQWTDDEKYCAKLFRGEVRFFTPAGLHKAALVLKLEGITNFSVSPGLSPSVAVFVPERGSKPAIVRMYGLSNFARPLSNKTFFKADKVDFHWHSLGTNVLVLTHTDVDKTGRSYYGETGLFFMAAAGNFDCRVPLDRDGPIHDVAWSPDEKEFVVSYGFMPAKTALFNHRAEQVFDFGVAPRNFVRYNPQGRVLAIAGFGNLPGQVDLWDRKKLAKIATIDAHGSSFSEWSPDGRYLLAATLSPRLRVDNGIKIWHYSGTLVYAQEVAELYQVDWRPAPAALFPQRTALSPVPAGIALPAAAAAKPKSTGAYRPPHSRLRDGAGVSDAPRSLSDMVERRAFGSATAASPANRSVPGAPASSSKGGAGNGAPRLPVGAAPDAADSAAAKKRRNRNRAKKTPLAGDESAADSSSEQPATTAPAAAAAAAAPAVPAEPTTEIDILKKIRAVKKKIGQIDGLIKRRDAGESLELNQLSKIATREQLESEVVDLTLQLSKLTPPSAA